MESVSLLEERAGEGRGGDVDVSCTMVGDFLRVPVLNYKEILFQRDKVEILVKHLEQIMQDQKVMSAHSEIFNE